MFTLRAVCGRLSKINAILKPALLRLHKHQLQIDERVQYTTVAHRTKFVANGKVLGIFEISAQHTNSRSQSRPYISYLEKCISVRDHFMTCIQKTCMHACIQKTNPTYMSEKVWQIELLTSNFSNKTTVKCWQSLTMDGLLSRLPDRDDSSNLH